MKIEFAGRTWQLDVDELGVKQAIAVCEYTGCTLIGWQNTLADPASPGWLRAMEALYWLMLAQNSQDLGSAPGDADFAVLKFSRAFAEGAEQEEKASGAESADPTKPAGTPAAASAKMPATATG